METNIREEPIIFDISGAPSIPEASQIFINNFGKTVEIEEIFPLQTWLDRCRAIKWRAHIFIIPTKNLLDKKNGYSYHKKYYLSLFINILSTRYTLVNFSFELGCL